MKQVIELLTENLVRLKKDHSRRLSNSGTSYLNEKYQKIGEERIEEFEKAISVLNEHSIKTAIDYNEICECADPDLEGCEPNVKCKICGKYLE